MGLKSPIIDAANQLKKDIVVDEEAFEKAAKGFEELSQKIDSLITNVQDMLIQLGIGWNTPAGRKYIESCQGYLLVQLAAQKVVCAHVSENLRTARALYRSVFEEYSTVINELNSGD